MAVEPFLKYPGSKARLAEWLIDQMPPTPFYLEPYAGSAIVWLALFQRRANWPKAAVINDIDGDVVNLFRVLRDDRQRERLLTLLAFTPWSRAEYTAHRDRVDTIVDPVDRAHHFVTLCWQGHGTSLGVRYNQGWRRQGLRGMRSNTQTWALWQRLPERLQAAVAALLSAEIECRPARELIRDYAGPDVLIYADPPYLGSVRNRAFYRHELRGVLEHARLLRDLRRHSGPVLLSGYAHPLYDGLLRDWQRLDRQARADKGLPRTESLWVNPVARQRRGGMFDFLDAE